MILRFQSHGRGMMISSRWSGDILSPTAVHKPVHNQFLTNKPSLQIKRLHSAGELLTMCLWTRHARVGPRRTR
jgi:hypothetical protein